jgi:hypothetical protein
MEDMIYTEEEAGGEEEESHPWKKDSSCLAS